MDQDKLQAFVSGEPELYAEGFAFTEGPLWMPRKGWIFSDIPADTIFHADGSVFRSPSGHSNGLTLDRQGRLIACEHGNRRVSRTEANGSVVTLADRWEGKRLNSPNDAVVRSDGTIFFTDPPYGLEGRPAELDFSGVYAILPDGTLRLLVRDFIKPNGLAFSPDEKILYIADTEANHLRAFQMGPGGDLTRGRVFCDISNPDGLKVDVRGNIWSTASDGVRIITPVGDLIGTIPFPEMPANCAFGDGDSLTLVVTARTGVYRVRCCLRGIHAASPR